MRVGKDPQEVAGHRAVGQGDLVVEHPQCVGGGEPDPDLAHGEVDDEGVAVRPDLAVDEPGRP